MSVHWIRKVQIRLKKARLSMVRRSHSTYSLLLTTSLVFALGAVRLQAAAGDAAKGKDVFEQCSVCHNADTDEKKMGPSLKGLFKKDKLVNGKKVSAASVIEQINNGGNGMPAYGDMLSQEEKDNLIAYLKTL